MLKTYIINIIFCSLLVMFLSFTIAFASECVISNIEGKTDAELQAIATQCEQEAAEQKALLESKQKESVNIERDISVLDYKIKTTDLDIRASQIKIYQLGTEIGQKEETILSLEQQAKNITGNLAILIRKTNELDSFSFLEALLSEQTLSNFFIDIDDFEVLKRDLNNALLKLREVKNQTEETKANLEATEMNTRGVKLSQEQEKQKQALYKDEKKDLLNLNRDQEAEYQATIAEKERVKEVIRNRLFRTVGGAELTFGEAYRLVQPYEERIGIEAALTLSILSQESGMEGLIGKNQGRCFYNQTATNSAGTVMNASQKVAFLSILKELGMDPDTTVVSCPIYSDGAYGGAMGPSQFMPRTWWDEESGTGYKNRVAKILGVSIPSPFNNEDAFVGTALYLSDALYRCKTAFSSQFDLWSCSAAKYYSGLNNTTANTLLKHMRPTYSYGYKVAQRAQQFQKDIDLLNN